MNSVWSTLDVTSISSFVNHTYIVYLYIVLCRDKVTLADVCHSWKKFTFSVMSSFPHWTDKNKKIVLSP